MNLPKLYVKHRSPATMAVMMLFMLTGLGGCANSNPRANMSAREQIRAEMDKTMVERAAQPVPARISDALLSPAESAATRSEAPAEPRFDLTVNAASAREVFQALVTDTRYSMLLHPNVGGTLSVTLKGVTIREALESIRDVYGYDFKMDGRRITVFPPTIQTRIFTVNYLNSQRSGRSEIRVSSGAQSSQSNQSGQNTSGSGSNLNNSSNNQNSQGNNQQQIDSSRVSTTNKTDFWNELERAVKSILGNAEGSSVTVSPQAGVIVVRAMPEELRQVDLYLKAAKVSVERQVMLEAKIVEVELRDNYQSGIDWSYLQKYTAIGTTSGVSTNPVLTGAGGLGRPGIPVGDPTDLIANAANFPLPGTGLFGLAFARKGFEAVLGFIESYGDVQVLSSPRVAALNNQQALLKVGTDEYFVTGVSSSNNNQTTNTSGGVTQQFPTIQLTPFFSGIALDITPQIDEGDTITLHVHPAVTSVVERDKRINLGVVGNFQLPLAVNSVNETDTMVRVSDGNIVAIGGLMQIDASSTGSGVPGSKNIPVISSVLGNERRSSRKKELVVLIKPTIIRSADDWPRHSVPGEHFEDKGNDARRIINLEGSPAKAKPGAMAK